MKLTKKTIIIAGVITLIVVGAGVGVFVWQRQSAPAKLQRLLKQQEEIEKKMDQLKQQVEIAEVLEESQRRERVENARGIGIPEGVIVFPQGDNLVSSTLFLDRLSRCDSLIN